MFLTVSDICTVAPRLTVTVGVPAATASSVSAQLPSAGAVTFVFCPVPLVGGGVAPVPSSSVPSDSRSPRAGRDGPLPPGTPSAKDGPGLADGVVLAGAGVGSCDAGEPLPRWSFLSPPEQETNSTMMPSRTAPSTTARRRQ
jgi:hypothetical protein